MRLTIGNTIWEELRWRVAMQLWTWGARIAPHGIARGEWLDQQLEWVAAHRKY